jgi:hypothetical protein
VAVEEAEEDLGHVMVAVDHALVDMVIPVVEVEDTMIVVEDMAIEEEEAMVDLVVEEVMAIAMAAIVMEDLALAVETEMAVLALVAVEIQDLVAEIVMVVVIPDLDHLPPPLVHPNVPPLDLPNDPFHWNDLHQHLLLYQLNKTSQNPSRLVLNPIRLERPKPWIPLPNY